MLSGSKVILEKYETFRTWQIACDPCDDSSLLEDSGVTLVLGFSLQR